MQEEKVKAIVEDVIYITKEEKELIEKYRVADDDTKKVILKLYDLK